MNMAKISFQLIPEGLDSSYNKALCPADRFTIPRVRRTVAFYSRARVKGLTARSLLPQTKAAWESLNQSEKEAWQVAGEWMNYSGYRLFTQDKVLRIKNDLAGNSMPSNIFQTYVGRLDVSAPATKIKITQLHPNTYWVMRKVRGTKSQYEPVLITENFDLPLRLSASYKSQLTSCGPNSYAKMYAEVISLYQGRQIVNTLTLNFDFVSDWQRITSTLDGAIGSIKGYTLFIEINDLRGSLWLDNLESYHSAQNWLRDPFCVNINSSFTRAFYQVPRNWIAVDIPTGAFFDSYYYN